VQTSRPVASAHVPNGFDPKTLRTFGFVLLSTIGCGVSVDICLGTNGHSILGYETTRSFMIYVIEVALIRPGPHSRALMHPIWPCAKDGIKLVIYKTIKTGGLLNALWVFPLFSGTMPQKCDGSGPMFPNGSREELRTALIYHRPGTQLRALKK